MIGMMKENKDKFLWKKEGRKKEPPKHTAKHPNTHTHKHTDILRNSSETPAALPKDIIHAPPLTLQTLPLCKCKCIGANTCVHTHFSSVIKLPKLWTNCSQPQLLQDDVGFFSPTLCSCLHPPLPFPIRPPAGSSSNSLIPSSHSQIPPIYFTFSC